MSSNGERKLFGTDGIRAIAGQWPLDLRTIYATGVVLGHTLGRSEPAPRVLIGRDTRESSPWIAATLAAGLRSAGAKVENSNKSSCLPWPRAGGARGGKE